MQTKLLILLNTTFWKK